MSQVAQAEGACRWCSRAFRHQRGGSCRGAEQAQSLGTHLMPACPGGIISVLSLKPRPSFFSAKALNAPQTATFSLGGVWCVCVCTNACMCVCMCCAAQLVLACVCVRVYASVCICLCTWICMCVCIQRILYAHACTRMCEYACVCTCLLACFGPLTSGTRIVLGLRVAQAHGSTSVAQSAKAPPEVLQLGGPGGGCSRARRGTAQRDAASGAKRSGGRGWITGNPCGASGTAGAHGISVARHSTGV